jgi:phenylacetic acid degradation operon negative regulatory protein
VTTSEPSVSDVLIAQPRALIVTIYGMYARDTGGWFSIAALIKLMAELGVDEPAVRSAISRLKVRGLLESGPVGGAAGYGLSAGGRKILSDGDRRIFRRPRASTDDGWLLAVFSVPEQQRARRHALRSRLAWLGFGTVSAGVWIAPGHLAEETRDVLEADDLAAYVSLFTAGYLAFGDVRDKISQWWDLDRLEELYQAFIDAAAPVLARWQGGRGGGAVGGGAEGGGAAHGGGAADGGAADARAVHGGGAADGGAADGDPGRAFADYVRVLTAWRRLPFLDPGLPHELLPPDWLGARAAELFGLLHDRLGSLAREHVLAVTE